MKGLTDMAILIRPLILVKNILCFTLLRCKLHAVIHKRSARV